MRLLKIGPVTRAMRAKEILEKSGIKASVKKLSESEGCVNALSVAPRELERAARLLSEAGIAALIIERS